MIYDFPDRGEPIRQGDIFIGVPRIDYSLKKMIIPDESGERLASWENLVAEGGTPKIMVSVTPIAAIVITQDCDAARSRDITLCEIRNFRDVERKSSSTNSPKGWKNILTQHARLNLKWFYLPPDNKIGFDDKMGVDFLVTISIPLNDLIGLKHLRCGRLNELAYEHFRERLSDFFRRYPYDEWYPLNKEEMSEYKKEYPDVLPFSWQKDMP
jgi:hypothetical protein